MLVPSDVLVSFPVDDSRVALNSTKDSRDLGNGYINASFIKVEELKLLGPLASVT